MDLAALLLTFTMFWKLSWSLQCYTCSAEHVRLPCTLFDYSKKYLVECEKSSMCFKRITTLEFGDGLKSHIITRGCAPQTTTGEQVKIKGKWRGLDDEIREVYEESCSDYPGNADRSTNTIHCYCRGDRCNGAQKILRNVLALSAMAVTVYILS